jgi:hypothetical protein
MVKIVFPMAAAATIAAITFIFVTIAGLSPASAERPDCNEFPKFNSRLTCYEAVSRAPPDDPAPLVRPESGKAKRAVVPKARVRRDG